MIIDQSNLFLQLNFIYQSDLLFFSQIDDEKISIKLTLHVNILITWPKVTKHIYRVVVKIISLNTCCIKNNLELYFSQFVAKNNVSPNTCCCFIIFKLIQKENLHTFIIKNNVEGYYLTNIAIWYIYLWTCGVTVTTL